jgi:transposase
MRKYKQKEAHLLKDEFIRDEELIKQNGEIWEYREITEDTFLNRWYKSLFWTKEKNLSGIQKLRLRQILREFDPHWFLWDAWQYKEWFCEALDELDIAEIRRVRNECLESQHYRIQGFWKTLLKRDKQLEAFCTHSTKDFKFTNAYTESFNNQCKVAKRVSHGFRNRENYLRKLSARFTNLNSRT